MVSHARICSSGAGTYAWISNMLQICTILQWLLRWGLLMVSWKIHVFLGMVSHRRIGIHFIIIICCIGWWFTPNYTPRWAAWLLPVRMLIVWYRWSSNLRVSWYRRSGMLSIAGWGSCGVASCNTGIIIINMMEIGRMISNRIENRCDVFGIAIARVVWWMDDILVVSMWDFSSCCYHYLYAIAL